MRDFHSHERVCVHIISSSKVCSRFYRDHGSRVSDHVLEKLEAEAYAHTKALQAQGKRRAYAGTQVPTRLTGPLHPASSALGVRHDCLLTKPPSKSEGGAE